MVAHLVARGRSDAPRLSATSLTVAAGRSLLLTGRNGAGKSTLLRLLAGHDRPDAGAVGWQGHVAPRISAHLGGQRLFPELTIGEHWDLLAATWPCLTPEDPARLLSSWGFPDLSHAFPDELSSGQSQAVHLALTLARPADLILLDEPERHLDQEAVAALGTFLARLPHVESPDEAGGDHTDPSGTAWPGPVLVVASHDAVLTDKILSGPRPADELRLVRARPETEPGSEVDEEPSAFPGNQHDNAPESA